MTINTTVLWVFGGIFLVLLVGTIAGAILSARAKNEESRRTIDNLNARTRSWWIMAIVIGTAVLLGQKAIILLFAFISFGALREFWTLTPSRRGDHRSLFLSFFVLLPAQYALLWVNWYSFYTVLIPVYAFLGLAAIATLSGETGDFLDRSARVQWGLMLCVYSISLAPALTTLKTGSDPILLLLYLVIVVQLSDVLQYVFGKLFGRHRFSPNISPSKTIEGLVGGGLSAILIGALLYPLTPFSPLQSAGMAAVIVVAGFFGGFVLSAVKRDLGVKDWGTLIEGHGGVLDRVDSLTFSAPLLFHLTRYWFAT
jgi:phosphatidate cytidylyltransferase